MIAHLQGFATSVCNVQVIFFVGVQLDITASPPPQAAADAQHLQLVPGHQVASTQPADAAPPNVSAEPARLQSDALMSPAAKQQVESQVGAADVGTAMFPTAHTCFEQNCTL